MYDSLDGRKAWINDSRNTTSSSGAAAQNQLCKPEEVGELRSKLAALEEAIAILADERDRLGNKLTPVIRQVPPSPAGAGLATSPSTTEVGNRIQCSIDRVRDVARSLNQLREDAAI